MAFRACTDAARRGLANHRVQQPLTAADAAVESPMGQASVSPRIYVTIKPARAASRADLGSRLTGAASSSDSAFGGN